MVAEQQKGDIDWMGVFNTVTTFILFNMLWLFGALFIVTIPAVTAALFAGVAPWSRGQSPYKPLAMFGKAMRHYGLKATAVALLDLFVLGFVILNLLIILQQIGTDHIMGMLALIVTSLVGITLILANVYLWPLLVTLDPPLRDLLKNGVRLGILHPIWGLLIAAAAAIPLVLSLILPGFFLLTLTFAASALIIYWGAWRIIQRYLTEKDLKDLGLNQ